MRTVNVIVMQSGIVSELYAFDDSNAGIKLAEQTFLKQCENYISIFNTYTKEDIEAFLDDGWCASDNTDIFLIHSLN